jgi:hypothetical protein
MIELLNDPIIRVEITRAIARTIAWGAALAFAVMLAHLIAYLRTNTK